MTRRRVGRWGIGLVGALTLAGFGFLFADPVLLAGACIPLCYVLYGVVSSAPPADLAVTRSIHRTDPDPGETVEVTLTVENQGAAVMADLRLLDGVPGELAVIEGSPRVARALTPGETVTVTYSVVAKRGVYRFDDPVFRLRSLAASEQVTGTVTPEGDLTLKSTNTVEDPPLQNTPLPRAGTLPTDSGGSGLSFYATRQYQHGDPMTRVDWRHYAKTGEFVTVQYREEKATRTVLVVDTRPVGRVTPRQGHPTGAELCAYAAERLYDALDRADVVTNVTAVGVEDCDLGTLVGPDGLPWIAQGTDGRPTEQARQLFSALQGVADGTTSSGGATAPKATDGGPDRTRERLLARLPPNAQVVLCTPLLDDWPVEFVRSLAQRGVPHIVVSPDVAGADSIGQQLTALDRRLRLRAIDRAGGITVSWDLEQPIDYALRKSLSHLLGQR